MKTAMVTGALGFLGTRVCHDLAAEGWRVIRIDQRILPGEEILSLDLLDVVTAREKICALPRPDVVIHLAAIAHNQRPPVGHTILSANTSMLRAVLNALSDANPHVIFASSVAVYGEANRPQVVKPNDELRPASSYGWSKVECEKMLRKSSLTDVEMMRFSPIYDSDHLQDVAKRVQFPGLQAFRMQILPEPLYNFCHVDTAAGRILAAVQKGRQGWSVTNVSDSSPYAQRELLRLFRGPIIPIPVSLIVPLVWFLKMVPWSRAYGIQCNLQKLLFTHLFAGEPLTLATSDKQPRNSFS